MDTDDACEVTNDSLGAQHVSPKIAPFPKGPSRGILFKASQL